MLLYVSSFCLYYFTALIGHIFFLFSPFALLQFFTIWNKLDLDIPMIDSLCGFLFSWINC